MLGLFRYRARVVGVAIVLLVTSAWLITTSSRYWARRSITVSRDGEPSPDAVAYRSKDGYYLIYISSEDDWYAFYPKDSMMGWCGMDKYVPFYFGVLLRDEAAPCVRFNAIKARDPMLETHADHFIFTSMRDQRVEVWWYGP